MEQAAADLHIAKQRKTATTCPAVPTRGPGAVPSRAVFPGVCPHSGLYPAVSPQCCPPCRDSEFGLLGTSGAQGPCAVNEPVLTSVKIEDVADVASSLRPASLTAF
eukprot:gene7880-1090_t